MTETSEHQDFDFLASRLEKSLSLELIAHVNAVAQCRPTSGRTYGFEVLGYRVEKMLADLNAMAADRRELASRLLIARIASRNKLTLNSSLTSDVRERTAESLKQLFAWLDKARENYWYPDDNFLKDYRFVCGMTVPCGAQVVDLAERPGIKTIGALATKAPTLALRSFIQPWFRPHTDARYLEEFNPDGWNRCYAEIAALYDHFPDALGLIATSWFYDPKVTAISPRLTYLRAVPMANGALDICHGTSQFDIDSSTKTSETRRKAYEAGEYMPQCWSILWPRAAMQRWAREFLSDR